MKEHSLIFEVEKANRSSFARYLNADIYKSLDDKAKKQMQEAWRADPDITVKEIQKALNLNMDTYYKELDRLGVPYKKRAPRTKRQRLSTAKKLESSCAIFFEGVGDPEQLLDILVRIEGQINPKAFGYKFSVKIEEMN